jgi:hypothetical protein
VQRLARAVSLALLSAICALAAHGVVYRSFLPAGSAHHYLGWYEPFVMGLTIVAGAVLAAFGALAATGRSLPWRFGTEGLWSRLSAGGVVLFLVQESLERWLSGGGAGVAALSAGTWLAVLAAVTAFSALVVLVARSGAALVRLARRSRERPRARRELPGRPQLFATPHRNPLAERRGLRAPPLLLG